MRILPKPEKHPTSFLAPLGKPGLHKNADVSGNTRLALPHHLRYLPDSQFHRPEQVNNPEPRRVGQSPEDVEYGCHEWSIRSEEHTSGLQSLMRISYAVFCLKKKTTN